MLYEYSREFVTLATSLNFTTAAKQLGLTQPTLSRHMSELEREVGRPLLDRSPVRLTPEGKYYLEHVSEAIVEFDNALNGTRELTRGSHITLSFARPVEEGHGTTTFCMAAASLNDLSSSVRITPTERPGRDLVECLLDGSIDCGFTYEMPRDVPSVFIYSEPPVAWLKRENPLAAKHPLFIRDFRDCVFTFSTDKTYEDWAQGVIRVCRLAGFEPKFSRKPNHSILDFALSNRRDEVMFTDALLASSPAFASGDFVVRHFDDDPMIEYVCYLAYSPHADADAVELLAAAMRDAAQKQGLNTDEDAVAQIGTGYRG